MARLTPLVGALTEAFRSDGDNGALLLDALYGLARRIATRLPTSDLIDEVVAKTALRICELHDKGTLVIDIANQVTTIMRNAVVDLLREYGKAPSPLEETTMTSSLEGPESATITREAVEKATALYLGLEENVRIALDRQAGGSTYAQIRTYMMAEFNKEFSEENLATIVSRQRAKLRKELGG